MQDRQLLKHILEATRDLWDRPETRASVRKEFPAVINCGTGAGRPFVAQNTFRISAGAIKLHPVVIATPRTNMVVTS
jgi:hypothetical protein